MWAAQLADARDTLAALDQVRQGCPGAWLGLLAAGVAWVPGAGDALKGAIRGGRKAAGEATEAAIEQGAKRVGTDAAEEAAETAARGTSPAGAASTIRPNSAAPSWQQYEQRYGGKQTPMETTFRGNTIKVRLDKPPSDAQIVDFKDFDWSNPSYQKPFVMKRVVEDFAVQIQKYKTIRPNVHLQFSRNPPSWVVDAIRRAGGTYSVAP